MIDEDIIEDTIEEDEPVEEKPDGNQKPAVTFRAVDVSGALFSTQGATAITTKQAKFERLASAKRMLGLAELRTRINVDLNKNATAFVRDQICDECPAHRTWGWCSNRAGYHRRFFCLWLSQISSIHVRLYLAKSMETQEGDLTPLERNIISTIKRMHPAPTKTEVVEHTHGARPSVIRDALDALLDSGMAERFEHKRGRQKVYGYKVR
jgi:hypothetical protein